MLQLFHIEFEISKCKRTRKLEDVDGKECPLLVQTLHALFKEINRIYALT